MGHVISLAWCLRETMALKLSIDQSAGIQIHGENPPNICSIFQILYRPYFPTLQKLPCYFVEHKTTQKLSSSNSHTMLLQVCTGSLITLTVSSHSVLCRLWVYLGSFSVLLKCWVRPNSAGASISLLDFPCTSTGWFCCEHLNFEQQPEVVFEVGMGGPISL